MRAAGGRGRRGDDTSRRAGTMVQPRQLRIPPHGKDRGVPTTQTDGESEEENQLTSAATPRPAARRGGGEQPEDELGEGSPAAPLGAGGGLAIE